MKNGADVPTVSVVVPVYNAARTIEACLESVLAQDYPSGKLEVIAVDNGSNDHTPEILRCYGGGVRLLGEPTRGPAAARNCGVRAATGEVVALTDADCIATPSWVRMLVAPLQDAAVGVVGGRILSMRPCNAVAMFGEEIHDHEKAITVYTPPYVITMNWAARRSLLSAAGLFDEDLLRCEDVDLAYRIGQLGYRFAYMPDAVVYHRNESTYAGLFREGFVHGLYSVQAIKKHNRFLAACGHTRFNGRSYRAIAAAFRDSVMGRDPERSLCVALFNTGKKLGKLAGSARFRHFDA